MTYFHRAARRDRTPMAVACLAAAAIMALGLLHAPAASAAPACAEAPAAARPAPGAEPALWVVRDADSTLYLFGTVHFLRPTTAWESPRILAAFDSADRLVLEVADPDDQSAVLPLVQQYGMAPDRPLSSLLTADEHARLDAAARTIGASAAQLDAMRPWLAGVVLSASALTRAGYEPGSGADMILRARALATGKPVSGLETPEAQVRMLAGFPEAGQLAFLRRTLDDFDNALVVPDLLVEAWAAGDVGAIERLAVAPMRQDSEPVYQAVLVERNTRWADQIEAMLEGSETILVAVGALHLVGDDSVQAILKARGVEVSVAP